MFASRMMMKGEEKEEMKTGCELREKRAIHLKRNRCSMRYKINTGKIRRIRKSISCLVSNQKGYGRICRGLTRRKVERIKRNGEPEKK
jgi:hypothetical protein